MVRRGGLLQQLTGLLHIQSDGQGIGMPLQVAALRVIAWQLMAHIPQLVLPPAELIAQRIAAGVACQARSPVSHGVGLGHQRLTTVQRLQVFQQHAPGHSIDHQVMDRQQQPLGALPVADQQGPQQWPLFQIQAALYVGVQRLTGIEIGHRGSP
ncbi:hypothetical protein D3C78_660480 [compost metagenome]